MRLASFLTDDAEHWGLVVTHPVDATEWVLEPPRVEAALARMSSVRTSGYSARRASFGPHTWPDELADFLAEGQEGMERLRRLGDVTARFLRQSDQTLLVASGFPVDEVELLAPVPRPRLVWGLVTNSPSFVRNNPSIPLVNLLPLGHQRPQGSVIGAGSPVVMRQGHHLPWFAYNVELGVVIGRGGRYIPIDEAMDHVAGFTTINDVSGSHYFRAANGEQTPSYALPGEYGDWFAQVTASWAGKMADTMCPVGPYLVTPDEIGDPYDLLVWTRQSGMLRDRSHTAGTLMGIERVIAWYSSFATLHAGDIIHFGTMGVDGLPVTPESAREDPTLEVEIEQVGLLRNPVEIRDPDSGEDLADHPSYAVRSLARSGGAVLSEASAWSPESARHFFTAFGNHEGAEGMARVPQPRFLNGPASSLGSAGKAISLPPRATDLTVAVELCVVVGRLASRVSVAEAFDHILGLAPMLSLTDHSFQAEAAEPARPAERGIPRVYGRWADGFNVAGALHRLGSDAWRGLRMTIEAGGARAEGSTDDYVGGPGELLSAISSMITLFPGDVISLGSTGAVLRIPAGDADGISVRAEIDGLGPAGSTLVRA
jgi:2-keto-4-pentenoate hydratase/2-oxohepta-3-ene-1,7-dioic acid hydratase in catechol pathway